jgi:hypothetical protein
LVEAYNAANGWSDYAGRIIMSAEETFTYSGGTITGLTDHGKTLTDLTIPASIGGVAVTAIAERAFIKTAFTGTLTIPNGVKTIGESAFEDCSGFKGDLTIPGSVVTIGNFAFSGCYGFKGTLTIESGVESIGWSAFSACSGFTGNLTLPDSVETIGEYAFFGCGGFTGNLTIGSGVVSIGASAFRDCGGLASVTVTATAVPSLGGGAFDGTNDCPIFVPADWEEEYRLADGWSDYAGRIIMSAEETFFFEGGTITGLTTLGRALTDLTIPTAIGGAAVTAIADNAFANCANFTGTLTVLNGIETIGANAFMSCGFTGDLTVPDSVTTIGAGAFSGCYGLASVTVTAAAVPSLGSGAFDGTNGEFKIYVPAGLVETYKAADGWKAYADRIFAITPPPHS